MNKNKNQSGYILVLTLLLLSILVIVVSGVFYSGSAFNILSKTWTDREKAKMLALSGVQLAISKLSVPKPKETQEQQKKGMADDKKKLSTTFLARILPSLNRWETIQLKEDIDGIDGQIKIAISCENGKININKIYDFAKHKFVVKDLLNVEKILQDLNKKITSLMQGKDFLRGLQDFLKKRKYPLNDVTELINIPEFSYFQNYMFYEPPNKNEDVEKWPIFLTDIFTIWTDKMQIQPLLFSDSILAILGLKRASVNLDERKQQVEQLIKNFKTDIKWQTDWDKILKPIYGKDFATLPKGIELLLDNEFDPNVFSVVSYGTVGEITQRVFAILQKQMLDNETVIELKKLYWI